MPAGGATRYPICAEQHAVPQVDLGRAWPCVAAVRAIADARRVSVARIALAWLLGKPHVTSVIIGAKRVEQLEDNLGAVDVVLTETELAISMP